jgi:hypothetical protein
MEKEKPVGAREKSQALSIIFLVLLITVVLVTGLSSLWENYFFTSSLTRDSARAFYVAEAGFQRSMLELAYDWNWTGINNASFCNGSYSASVSGSGQGQGSKRTIVSTGTFNGAQKQITIRVTQGSQEILDNNGNHYGWRNNPDKGGTRPWEEI